MTNENGLSNEINRLMEILYADRVDPNLLESGLESFSTASKNAAATQITQAIEDSLPGRVLARLMFILTDENKETIETVSIENLHSNDPEARKFSLYNLQRLEHPDIVNFALGLLEDNADQVLVAACSILLPEAKEDSRILSRLQELYAAKVQDVNVVRESQSLRAMNREENQFYGVTKLLEAYDINNIEPGQN